MAKKDKKAEKVAVNIPEGFKCYKKIGGGSYRFQNRIIKTGQNFWIDPDAIPTSFKDLFKEIPDDNKAVVIHTNVAKKSKEEASTHVPEKFELVQATDENGEVLVKGKGKNQEPLYNVVDEGGKPMNDAPLRKGKAEELLAALSV